MTSADCPPNPAQMAAIKKGWRPGGVQEALGSIVEELITTGNAVTSYQLQAIRTGLQEAPAINGGT